MKKVSHITNKRVAREEAAAWIVRVDNDNLSAADSLALRKWLSDSQANRTAFIELSRLWGTMDSLAELSELIPLDEDTAQQRSPEPHVWRQSMVAYSLAIAMFLIVGFGVIYSGWNAEQQRFTQVATTNIGDQQTLKLPDGSSVLLNTDSNVNVHYDVDNRHIYLNRGEAHFDVAHDPDRPFVVYAGGGRVTAIGTAFNVQRRGDRVDVIVTDGIVDVVVPDVPPDLVLAADTSTTVLPDWESDIDKTKSVRAGQKVSFDTEVHSVNDIKPQEVERRLSWQKGMLFFSGEPLEKAIAEISRYTETQIIINDPAVADLAVGGYFKVGETESMLEVLRLSFGISVTYLPDNVVLLSRGEMFELK